jgi:sarcosine oxidase subunit beta
MQRYSGWRVLREGLAGNRNWQPAWRSPSPKPRYDVVIIGGGGHGLATAYYLAKNHNITNVAVLERDWIGGGNTGRNTTVIRSNYFYPESIALFQHSIDLYENLSKELNYNIMFSQRGLVSTGHTRHDMELMARWAGVMQAHGVDADLIDVAEVKRRLPRLVTEHVHLPVLGGFAQKRAGTARHDAVAWGYARGADALGVDIIQNCEVQAFAKNSAGRVTSVKTNLGEIGTDTIVLSVAGNSSVLAKAAGFDLPVTSMTLQAFVSEPLKPVLDTIFLSLATGLYVSQSDKGGLVFGGGLDIYNSYGQRGGFPVAQQVIGALTEHFPSFGRVRLLRQWGGTVDIVHDSSPILGHTPVPGLLINCGWGTGGFKAIPAGGWLMAYHVATGQPHQIAAPFGLSRFETGRFIDEAAGAGIAH